MTMRHTPTVLRWLLLLILIAGPSHARPTPDGAVPQPAPRGPVWIQEDDGIEVLVYPPREDHGTHPIFVQLHGMCDEPENECPLFADAVTARGWLVCPRARLRCAGGGSIWHYPRRHETVERSVEAVQRAFPGLLDETPGRTLIGFSLGGIFGMDIAHLAHGEYRRVIVIGARVYPDARQLHRAGVERIVLAAGARDMTHSHLLEQARRLQRQGMEARFVSLGDAGHWFPRDLTSRMTEILDWASE